MGLEKLNELFAGRKLVIATNQNDILDRAMRSGAYVTDGVKPSISPSMDIQVSSNFERALFDAYGRDGAAVAQLMAELMVLQTKLDPSDQKSTPIILIK